MSAEIGSAELYAVIAIVGLGTYLIRLSFIYWFSKKELSSEYKLVFSFIPAATLSAIVFPAVLNYGGSLNVSLDNHRLLAIVVAVLVAWKTKSTLAVLGVGMSALWLLDYFFPPVL